MSCRISVTSVPSLRAAAVAVLRLDGGARGEQRLDHLQVAFPSRIRQRPVASGSTDDGDTTRKVTGRSCSDWNPYQQRIGKSQLRTYNNLLNLQAYPFSGVRHLCRLAPGSGGPPAASVGQLRCCLLSQPAGCLRLKTAETLDVWQSKVYSYNILYQWISHNVSSCHNSIDSRFCGFGVPELGSFDY